MEQEYVTKLYVRPCFLDRASQCSVGGTVCVELLFFFFFGVGTSLIMGYPHSNLPRQNAAVQGSDYYVRVRVKGDPDERAVQSFVSAVRCPFPSQRAFLGCLLQTFIRNDAHGAIVCVCKGTDVVFFI